MFFSLNIHIQLNINGCLDISELKWVFKISLFGEAANTFPYDHYWFSEQSSLILENLLYTVLCAD